MFPEASDLLWKSGKAKPTDSKWQRRGGADKLFEASPPSQKRRARVIFRVPVASLEIKGAVVGTQAVKHIVFKESSLLQSWPTNVKILLLFIVFLASLCFSCSNSML